CRALGLLYRVGFGDCWHYQHHLDGSYDERYIWVAEAGAIPVGDVGKLIDEVINLMNKQASKTVSRVLTGITTSGTPHLGNYVGSIRPSVRASLADDVQSFYFLADYHALIKIGDPARVQRSTLEIAASWLAAGVDPERVTFYRQSDIPEIPELTWLLTCVTGKGMLCLCTLC
ncbi:MAG: hypothetical protein RJB10_1229, partial [Pseudomonadota bacterium]